MSEHQSDPEGVDLNDLRVGSIFLSAAGLWSVLDKDEDGVTAIRIDDEKATTAYIFDEFDLEGCDLVVAKPH